MMRASWSLSARHARISMVMGLVLLVGTSACDREDGATVIVFAAASLTDAFEEMAAAFEAANPDADIELTFDGSARLATQIVEGAPAEVFASADEQTMATVVEADLVRGAPRPLAENSLAIVTREGNPDDVRALDDLARSDLVVVLADPAVPVGRYAAAVFDRAGIEVDPATNEANARAVVSRIALGEADVGIAYVTDVPATSDDVDAIPIPRADNLIAQYSIAAIGDDDETAPEFVDFAVSDEGQAILESHGFGSQ